jgi:hypothetical protein
MCSISGVFFFEVPLIGTHAWQALLEAVLNFLGFSMALVVFGFFEPAWGRNYLQPSGSGV